MCVKKMAIWGDFQGIAGVTRGGRGVKSLENWGDFIYICMIPNQKGTQKGKLNYIQNF